MNIGGFRTYMLFMVQTWILGTTWGLNWCSHVGAMFSIVWYGLEHGLDLVTVFTCVNLCRTLQF